jgi:hypothetical protein
MKVNAALFRYSGRADVVEQGIERDGLTGPRVDVLVVSGL